MTTAQTIMLGLFLLLLAFIAAAFDDSMEARDHNYYPEPKKHSGVVNYGKPN